MVTPLEWFARQPGWRGKRSDKRSLRPRGFAAPAFAGCALLVALVKEGYQPSSVYSTDNRAI